MREIILGLVLALISVKLGNPYINYTPAFLGYLLIFVGLGRGWESPSRSGSRTIAIGCAVLSAVVWALPFFGYGTVLPVEATLQVLMTYRLLRWCEEQEGWQWGFRIQRLRLSWYAFTGATVAAYVLGMANWMLWLVWSVAALAAAVFYIYTFLRLRRLAPEEYRS